MVRRRHWQAAVAVFFVAAMPWSASAAPPHQAGFVALSGPPAPDYGSQVQDSDTIQTVGMSKARLAELGDVKGQWELPRGGHETCPVTASRTARWWPWNLPKRVGHHRSS